MKKLFILLLTMYALTTNAQNLTTDSLFGNNGEVFSIPTGTQTGATYNLLKQPDGKLIVCGNTYHPGGVQDFFNNMFRVDACGQVDSAFGTNGMVQHSFDYRNLGLSYLLKDDGKIMVVGTQSSSNASSQQFPFIARYNIDGSPDTSFATLGSNKITNSGASRFNGIYKANDGKWLCTNITVVMRFDSLGIQDTTFGTNGLVNIPPSPINGYIGGTSLMRSDNKIISAAPAYNGGPTFNDYTTMYTCYDTLGIIDSTYGTNGVFVENNLVTHGFTPRLLLQSTDKLISVSENDIQTQIITIRYNTNGTVDSTFGINGSLIIPGTTLHYLSALDNDNFLIGFQQNGFPPQFLKITANGLIDSTFLLNGSPYFQFANFSGERAQVGLYESNGDLIMASAAYIGQRMALAKFTPNSAVPHITQIFTTLNSNVSAIGVSFQWYLNGTAITGATDSIYVFNQNGIYSVEVTNNNGCNSLSDSLTVINVGIKIVNSLPGISFFPNPVQNDLTIINANGKELTIKLFDVIGKIILTEKVTVSKQTLSLSNVVNGIYILEIQSENTLARNKIVKQ